MDSRYRDMDSRYIIKIPAYVESSTYAGIFAFI